MAGSRPSLGEHTKKQSFGGGHIRLRFRGFEHLQRQFEVVVANIAAHGTGAIREQPAACILSCNGHMNELDPRATVLGQAERYISISRWPRARTRSISTALCSAPEAIMAARIDTALPIAPTTGPTNT